MSKQAASSTIKLPKTISPIEGFMKEIEELETQKRKVALAVIWEYDPDSEDHFSSAVNSFVTCVGQKKKAYELLAITPATLYRWMNEVHVPRKFVRAGFKSRAIDILGKYDGTTAANSNTPDREDLKRRRGR